MTTLTWKKTETGFVSTDGRFVITRHEGERRARGQHANHKVKTVRFSLEDKESQPFFGRNPRVPGGLLKNAKRIAERKAAES